MKSLKTISNCIFILERLTLEQKFTDDSAVSRACTVIALDVWNAAHDNYSPLVACWTHFPM